MSGASQSCQTFKYPQCKKGQFHTGEALSLVCVQSKCIENSVICGICYNEEHKTHNIKPLKIIIKNAIKYLDQLTPLNIDGNKLKQQINEQKKNVMVKFDEFQKFVTDSLSNIRESINAVYIKITQKIDLKTGSKEQLMKTLQQIKSQQVENQKFISLMKKLLAGIPQDSEQQNMQSNSKQIEDSINSLSKKIQKNITAKSQLINKQITAFSEIVKKLAQKPGIFDPVIQFKFSPELKHHGVEVVSDNVIKSVQGYNYHFSLMEPGVSEKGQKNISVQFQIKESGSNWIAIGLCHKNIVKASSFTFNYSTLGHGGYLISSNGGSWSSIDSSKNNVVNSFNYSKNDIIILQYKPEQSKVVFTKKGSDQTHTLEVESKEDDDLHLCCLFYYTNDQIEFLGNYDQK